MKRNECLEARRRLAICGVVALTALAVGIGTVHAFTNTGARIYATGDCPPLNLAELEEIGAVSVTGEVDLSAAARLRRGGVWAVSLLNGNCELVDDTVATIPSDGGGDTAKFKFSYAGKKLYLDFFNTQTKKHNITGAIKLKHRGGKKIALPSS